MLNNILFLSDQKVIKIELKMKMTRDDILYLPPNTPTLFTAIVKETLVHRNVLAFFMQIHL